MPPPVMKRLVPLITYSSPSRVARVLRVPASEPASGSVRASAPRRSWPSSLVHIGRKRSHCSAVPITEMAVAARPLTWVPRAIPAQPHDSSSAVIIAVIPGSAACPPSGTPVRPIAAALAATSQANSLRSSYSRATGRTSLAENACAVRCTRRSASVNREVGHGWLRAGVCCVAGSIRGCMLPAPL